MKPGKSTTTSRPVTSCCVCGSTCIAVTRTARARAVGSSAAAEIRAKTVSRVSPVTTHSDAPQNDRFPTPPPPRSFVLTSTVTSLASRRSVARSASKAIAETRTVDSGRSLRSCVRRSVALKSSPAVAVFVRTKRPIAVCVLPAPAAPTQKTSAVYPCTTSAMSGSSVAAKSARWLVSSPKTPSSVASGGGADRPRTRA